jgi:AmmeMemoRadiSam system protein A
MLLSGFIMPHPPILIDKIGKGTENNCPQVLEALDKVSMKIKELAPETIVFITPHGPVFSDGMAIGYDEKLVGNLEQFGNFDTRFEKSNDLELVDKLIFESGKIDIPLLKLDDDNADYFDIPKTLDHGTTVPMHFIDKHYSAYKMVHLTYGLFDSTKLYEFGMLLNRVIKSLGRKTVIIASGDMSHALMEKGPYAYHPSGAKFDDKMKFLLLEQDVKGLMFFDETLQHDASECGKRSIDILLGALDVYKYESNFYAYEGPFGVGYLVMGFEGLTESGASQFNELLKHKLVSEKNRLENESRFVQLARRAIENYLGLREDVMDDSITYEMLDTRAGVFVSLKKQGALRGCIGTIGPTEDNIALEIVANAIKAGFEDPRFPELESGELNELAISVDVLMAPEEIESIEALDPKKYGVIVTSGYKRGLLLPNLEGIDTAEEQVRIACQKGSIGPNDSFKLERFEVVRYY